MATLVVIGDNPVRQSFLEVTTFSYVSPFTHWETSFEYFFFLRNVLRNTLFLKNDILHKTLYICWFWKTQIVKWILRYFAGVCIHKPFFFYVPGMIFLFLWRSERSSLHNKYNLKQKKKKTATKNIFNVILMHIILCIIKTQTSRFELINLSKPSNTTKTHFNTST